jgi:hypothetical protein
MATRKLETINTFNSQVEKIKSEVSKLGKTDVSLILFGEAQSPVRVAQKHVTIDSVALLNDATYLPHGFTPMRDGIGTALSIGEAVDGKGENEAFLLICITDGAENASKEWTPSALAAKIEALRGTKRWTFQVLGTNIDFTNVQDFGIARSEYSNFKSMNVANESLVDSLTRYAHSRTLGKNSTDGLNIPDSD